MDHSLGDRPISPEARQIFKPTTGRRAYRERRSVASDVDVGVGICRKSALLGHNP